MMRRRIVVVPPAGCRGTARALACGCGVWGRGLDASPHSGHWSCRPMTRAERQGQMKVMTCPLRPERLHFGFRLARIGLSFECRDRNERSFRDIDPSQKTLSQTRRILLDGVATL